MSNVEYAVIPVGDLLPGEPCERWNERNAKKYCAEYNDASPERRWPAKFQPGSSFSDPSPERTHAIVALPRPSKAPEVAHVWQALVMSRSFQCSCGAEVVEKENGDLGPLKFPSRACEGAWEGFDAARSAARKAPAQVNTTIVMGDSFAAESPRHVRHKTVAQAPVKAEPVGPTRPTDAEIVKAWEAMWQWNEQPFKTRGLSPYESTWTHPKEQRFPSLFSVTIGPKGSGFKTVRSDFDGARSRVLASRIAASAERERLSVLGPIDHWEHA